MIATLHTRNRLAFLDSHPQVLEDGSIKLKVYRKPTHTDQYLSFSSNHPIEHKLGVIRTLYNRAETIVTTPEDRTAESWTGHSLSVVTPSGH